MIDAVGESDALEAPAARVADAVRGWFAPRAVKNALSGVWLGHRLHPLLTDAVIGTWASAGLLDLLGDRRDEPAAQRLVAAGLAASIPTVAAGLSDYSDLYDHGRRIAFVHAMAADAASVLQAASLLARRGGHAARGRWLSLAALGVVGAAGYLGGHLSQVLGVGVDHTAFDEGPKDWEDTGVRASDVTSTPQVVVAGEHQVLLVRVDGAIVALANRCSHAGWPLDDGPVEDGCITCPYHGSVFRLADGAVVRGPAAAPQLRYGVRERDGRVEVVGPR
ncbi:MAG: Rieske 2Fe-2S domain-containing protein [Actinobacteria bacterium]|nr:Rieske 2Fe-2S domain-containing protein [Actinomycetota bacterium]